MSTTRTGNLQGKLMKYLDGNQGKVLHLADIARSIEGKPGSIQSAMNRMSRENRIKLEVLTAGQTWRYLGPGTAERKAQDYNKGDMFVCIGQASDGSILLEAEDGVVYRAYKL